MTVSGTCLCGAIKVTAEGEPNETAMCYCSDCRKMSGNLGHLVDVYNSTKVKYDDPDHKMKIYCNPKTDSGKPTNVHFCKECGVTFSTVPMVHDGNLTMLRPTSLDSGWNNRVPTGVVHGQDLNAAQLDAIAKCSLKK